MQWATREQRRITNRVNVDDELEGEKAKRAGPIGSTGHARRFR